MNEAKKQKTAESFSKKNNLIGLDIFKEVKRNYILFLMLTPALLYFLIFQYVPMVGAILAFKKFDYIGGVFGSPWVAFDNFKFLFVSGVLLKATTNTILYNLVFLTTRLAIQMFIAILLSELASKIYAKVAQSIMFLPYFVSYVLLAAFVYNMFSYETGTFNSFLKSFGMQPIDMYANPGAWKYILLVFYQWKYLGYGTVVFLATIIGINTEYYEAARIDGATKFQEIRHITLPMLKPTVVILILFAIGNIMRGQFELFYQIIGNNGQLFAATDIIDTVVFRMLTVTFDVGMGAAAGLYQSVIGLIIIVSVNYIIKKVQEEYALF